ncbi:uncharacterized protein [Onthophagus taurus]|uniref:uncharacterized protein isoform X4 n=1 Tax=Onthophagus taurus TaxID=166361 RepID=UPI0039BDD210
MRRLILKKMNGKRKVSIVGLRQKFFAVILTMAFVHRSDAMPTNPGSLKQNIMTADISGSDLLGAGNGGGTAIGGGPQQINPQDPKLTPVRGTKDEQCSDKENMICKLQHDLKEAEQSIQSQIAELQRALSQSNAAEKTSGRLFDQQLNTLNQAVNGNKAALFHAQEMSAKICGNGPTSTRYQRVISNNQDDDRILTTSTPGNKEKIQNNIRPHVPSAPSGRSRDYTEDYFVEETP